MPASKEAMRCHFGAEIAALSLARPSLPVRVDFMRDGEPGDLCFRMSSKLALARKDRLRHWGLMVENQSFAALSSSF